MVFGIGRKDAREEREQARDGRVPYRLASYEHDSEGKRFKSSNVVFSFWSAAKYVLILSLILWWLPMFGQMIAGYVGGRRAGGPWRGVAAAIVPVVGIFGVMTAFEQGWLPAHIGGVALAPAAIGAALTNGIPFLSPYLQFSQDYIGSFVDTLAGSSPYGINTYVLTVAFAYVGGVLAEQNRREIQYTSGSVTNHTTVLVHDPSGYGQQEQPAAAGGLLAGIGGLFHLGGRAHNGAGVWADPGPMRYREGEGDMDERFMLPQGEPAYDVRAVPVGQQQGRHKRHHHHRDPWNQKRRGATNYSAKPRFNYPQYQDQPRQEDREHRGGFRRSKDSRFTVSTDPRSIKRVRRAIDQEWGRRKYPVMADRRNYEPEAEAVAVEREPEPQQHHQRDHHPHEQWDTI